MAEPSSDYGASIASNASATGQSALNSFDPTGFANSVYTGLFGGRPTNLLGPGGTQEKGISDYMGAYKDAIASNPTATQLYQTANQQYNVPGLASTATDLNNRVLNAPNTNLNLARGFNYDQNQVDAATTRDLRILQPLASAATSNWQTAAGLADKQVGYGLQQNATNLLPVQAQGQMMADLWARQSTGFTSAMEQELQGLMGKMNAGIQLSATEMSRANTLAQAQTSYKNAITSANAQIASSQIGNQNVTLSPGQTYLNTITGKAYNPFVSL